MTEQHTTPKESTMPRKSTTPTLYKAVRPDGLDFATRTIDYAAAFAAGKTVKHPNPGKRDASEYLSVSDSIHDFPGASWPLRLFEVEIVGESWKPGDYAHKIAGHEIRILREIDAHLVYGPEGKRIAEIVDQYWEMGDEDHEAMRDLRRDGFYDAWWRVRDAAGSLGVGSRPAWFVLGLFGVGWGAGLGGALALLVRSIDPSKITEGDYEILSEPWREYVGAVQPDDALPAKGRAAE